MWQWFHQWASPPYFYCRATRLTPWLGYICTIFLLVGLYTSFFVAPPDYQQGEGYRIIFIHVPSAWMSMIAYVLMGIMGIITLIWRVKLADWILENAAPLGASFTFLALITGSIWGKPMWGTWWVWDARLTSELILLFLYLGIIALRNAIDDPRTAATACSILTIVGLINIPIIHYSVEWWNTLHQGPTITKFDKPSIHITMLIPLILMAIAFKLYFATVLLIRVRTTLLKREHSKQWIRELEGK